VVSVDKESVVHSLSSGERTGNSLNPALFQRLEIILLHASAKLMEKH
jgi:hypothetical protein